MRATRLSKLLLKALRTDSNTIASVPLNFSKLVGQTANFMEVRDTDDTTILAAIDANGVFASPVAKTPLVKDTSGVTRAIFNATTKTIVDGSATALFDVACADDTASAGLVFYQVFASNGTDHQTMAGMISYSGVSKAGTLTATNPGYATANDCKSVSSGTLTLAWTSATGTAKFTVKLQPTGSLTETVYWVKYTVFPISGAVTIL